MRISAHISNGQHRQEAMVESGAGEKFLTIAPAPSGHGSSVNGGELLFLALATCYCDDLYREAARRGIEIESVDVDVDGEFGTEGQAAGRIEYSARVVGDAPEQKLLDLMAWTDTVTEIQNTVRGGVPVVLRRAEATEATGGLRRSA